MLKPANSGEPCKNRPMQNCTLISDPTQLTLSVNFKCQLTADIRPLSKQMGQILRNDFFADTKTDTLTRTVMEKLQNQNERQYFT